MNGSRPDITAAGSFCVRCSGRPAIPALHVIFIGVAVLLIWINGSACRAQSTVSLEGRVYDAVTRHPVSQALVRVDGTDYRDRTNTTGNFRLEHIPPGTYRLVVSAEGYRRRITNDIRVSEDMAARADIVLDRIVYELGEREVRGRRMPDVSSAAEVLDGEDIRSSGAATVAEVLDRLAGVYVQKSGSGAGGTRISIRGSDPEHVLVLIDGQRIYPAGGGQADIETIPVEIVERIEVYRGGESARFGPDAIGGVINIITMKSSAYHPELRTETYQGIWNTGVYRVSLDDPIHLPGVAGKVTYSLQKSDGDFPYRYSVEPASRVYSGVRKNADCRTQNLFGTVSYRLHTGTSLHFSGQAYRSRQGLPGSVSRIDTTSRKKDARLLATFRAKHAPSHNVDVELELGRSRFEQHFNNVNHKYRDLRYEDRYVNDLTSTRMSARYRYLAGAEIAGGVEFRRDVVKHENLYRPDHSMSDAIRDYVGVFLIDRHEFNLTAIPFWKSLAVDYTVRRDHVAARRDDPEDDLRRTSDNWSYKTGMSLTHGSGYKLVLRASYGKSLRLPSINALFWSGNVRAAANPDLRPERAEHSDAGFEISYDGPVNFSAGMTYFHSYVSDLIVWQPGYQQVWKPVNVEAARISGHEDVVRVAWHDDLVSFTYRNTVTVAKNRSGDINTDGKHLIFRPHYVTDLEWRSRYRSLRASYRIRLVDVRYSTAANTRWYDAYRVDDASLGAVVDLSAFTVDAAFRIHNLLDERYELIGQYPMPGREWGIRISLTYRL